MKRGFVAFSENVRRFATGSTQVEVIKKLRDRTGAPLGDVKKALEEVHYDFDQAYDALRVKGLAAAAKKADRVAVDGLVGVASDRNKAAIVEVNCETDFVARNARFGQFVGAAASALLHNSGTMHHGSVELKRDTFLKTVLPSTGHTLEDTVAELSGIIREKINIRRAYTLQTHGRVFTYCHNPPPVETPGLGKIACAVSLDSAEGSSLTALASQVLERDEFGGKLAMHVAAMKPKYLDKTTVDKEHLEHEMMLLRQQAKESGKAENIVERIVQGRMEKFYEEFCLLQQRYLFDEEKTVEQQLLKFTKANDLVEKLIIGRFLRVQCGEGVMNKTVS